MSHVILKQVVNIVTILHELQISRMLPNIEFDLHREMRVGERHRNVFGLYPVGIKPETFCAESSALLTGLHI
jgi:hypothetical protein